MPVTRVFERNGKELAVRAHDHDEALELLTLSRTRLRQGWVPKTAAKAAIPFVRALVGFGVPDATWVNGLTDQELDVVYADLIKRGEDISDAALMKRPTRKLFAYLLKTRGHLLKNAVRFLSRQRGQTAWIVEELDAALARRNGFADDSGRRFAERWLERLNGAPAVAPVHDDKTSEAQLLAAILESPDTNGPREIYADWLIDQGNPFGEFIHAAIAAAADESKTELADALEKKYARDWLAPIKPFARSTRFHGGRGMVASVTTEGEGFVKAAAAIAARAPRGELRLQGVKKKHIAALAAAPLGAFERVDLAQQRLDDAAISTLFGAPSFSGIVELDLSGAHFGDPGLLAIANSPNATSIEVLDLGRRYGGDPSDAAAASPDALALFFASKRLPKLRKLEIFGAAFEGVFVGAVHALTSLAIDAQTFSNRAATELASCKAFANLESLAIRRPDDAQRYAIDDVVLAALAKKLRKLTYLYVDDRVIKEP